jgi:hypothetical protein
MKIGVGLGSTCERSPGCIPSGTGSQSAGRKREEPRSAARYHCGLRTQPETAARMKRFRLLIVDDEPLIRAGIRDGLSERGDIEVAGECGSVSEAVDILPPMRWT